MRRSARAAVISAVVSMALLLGATAAWAGSPHFVGAATVTKSASTLTVSAKEAGLGNEDQIVVVITATALCINGGGNHPKAVNKATFSSTTNQPVQNGKADYTVTLTATFSPSCDPPMTVEWRDITVLDQTNGISQFFADP